MIPSGILRVFLFPLFRHFSKISSTYASRNFSTKGFRNSFRIFSKNNFPGIPLRIILDFSRDINRCSTICFFKYSPAIPSEIRPPFPPRIKLENTAGFLLREIFWNYPEVNLTFFYDKKKISSKKRCN